MISAAPGSRVVEGGTPVYSSDANKSRRIENLHVDIQAFYADYLPGIQQTDKYILLKVAETHRWSRKPDGAQVDGSDKLRAGLSKFPGFEMSTLDAIQGHFTIKLADNCDIPALTAFLESQDYILGALPIPNQHCTLVPDAFTMYVLTNRVDECIKACNFNGDSTQYNSGPVSTHRELSAVRIKFDKTISLPAIYFKVKKLSEDPKNGIVEFLAENLGMVCRKQLWDRQVREFKSKHNITD